jgi:hypothetical protein
MKLPPSTVSEIARLPAGALVGKIEVMLGAGLFEVDDDEEEELSPPHPAARRAKITIQTASQ